jgi:exopolyphosphatase / guanosine-5'-triphosphate,3'-diphosphate pyrophosphatase
MIIEPQLTGFNDQPPEIADQPLLPESTVTHPIADAHPLRIAAIDIGSNAIRLLAVEFSKGGLAQQLEQIRLPIRLGHDVFLTGRLAPEVIDAAINGLKDFRTRIDAHGIALYRATATSAVRDSRNGSELVRRAREEAGIEIDVISGAEEARLVHIAVRNRVKLGRQRWLIADLGGGSVEVSVVDDHGIFKTESHEMGSVRLLEELAVAGDDPGRFRRRLEEYTATLRNSRVLHAAVAGFVATGGNIEALARLADAKPDRNGVATLRVDDLRKITERLAILSYQERVEQLNLREDRADVILPAAMVYERVAVLAGVDTILVPNVGLKDGIVYDLLEQQTFGGKQRTARERSAYSGAIALGRRFHFDEAHARHVARLAASIFDQTKELHNLKRDDRRLLVAAAILHDIGTLIGYKRHHKHSLYLISESELPGMTAIETLMVANIARYHRKNTPAPHHESFMRLDEKDRDRVLKLSAILRLADSLDREHLQRVDTIRADLKGKVLELTITGRGDLLLERWALQRKAQFFQKTFDVAVLWDAAE